MAVNPSAQSGLDRMKYEVASQIGVNLNKGYNGDILSKDAGRVGGQMVKKMIEETERSMTNR